MHPETCEEPPVQSPTDGAHAELPEITVSELDARIAAGEELVLVDVRQPFEREIADLPDVGQLRIPLDELMARAGEIDPARRTVLYCRSGARSGWATRMLLARGYRNVLNLKGGVMAWRDEVDPSLPTY